MQPSPCVDMHRGKVRSAFYALRAWTRHFLVLMTEDISRKTNAYVKAGNKSGSHVSSGAERRFQRL